MFNRDFISNLTSIFAITLYSMSLTDILTLLVLASAFTLNMINITYKLKNKEKLKKEE